MKKILLGISGNFLLLALLPVQAADFTNPKNPQDTVVARPDFSFYGGIGYTALRADEFVYEGTGKKLSQLIWKSDIPTLTGKAKIKFDGDWTLSGQFIIGLTGNSRMTDYDWAVPPPSGYEADAWSHRSQHPDTQLDHYWAADAAIGHDFSLNDTTVLNLHGGIKYTSVKWSAYGGSYIYSTEGDFRNEIHDFTPGVPVISYQQTYPTVFLGMETTRQYEKWLFAFLVRGGLSLQAKDEDNHWLRDLKFAERFDNVPFLSVGIQMEYNLSPRASLFLNGNMERYFHRIGNAEIYDIKGLRRADFYEDAAGMKLQSWTVSTGLKYMF